MPPARGGARRRPARTAIALMGAVAALLLPPTALAAPPAAAPDAGSIDRYVRDYMEETGLPGAVVAVTRGDRVVRAAGYGRTAAGRPMTAHTPVPVASLSKAMTAMAVLQLVEAGRVDLDRPVRHYLPEFTMADRRARRITVRQLLNQTSGMADSAHPDLTLPQPRTLRQAVAGMRRAELAADPGSEWNYHNPNYFVAARLVEVVGGRPFAEHLSARVLRPLGMSGTESVGSTTDMPEQARGYVRAYGLTVERPHPRWFAAGSFGVVTTADDLTRWLVAQNNHGVSADGRRAVSARSIRTMHTPPEGGRYAMGWAVSGPEERPRRIEHTGWLLTHNSVATLLPDSGIGIAVVTNTGMVSGDDAPALARGLADLARGGNPAVTRPFTMTADHVLAALTLLAAALGALGVVRAPRWAGLTAHRPPWRSGLRMLPYCLPVLLLVCLADVFGLFMNRSGTLWQAAHAWPALAVCSATAALASTAVITARALTAFRVRRARPPRGRSRG
ncbi:serine hydrolase domain-containing protein [Streptomyces sp. HB2AG]|uniref:serine hydrolase domain-containing protein n=1 Tax=Streptomyces sp. HB2AG TaxID=2983400 RepID=UPI002E7C1FF6|nr:serine hydrolase domain-containing protein [Streptomyces sp. HB2AG]